MPQPLSWPNAAFTLAGNAYTHAIALGGSTEIAFALFISTYTACYLVRSHS